MNEGGRQASSAKKKVGMRWVENCEGRQQEGRKENVGVQTLGRMRENREIKRTQNFPLSPMNQAQGSSTKVGAQCNRYLTRDFESGSLMEHRLDCIFKARTHYVCTTLQRDLTPTWRP